MQIHEIANAAFKTITDAGLTRSRAVRHSSTQGRTWVKMEGGNFDMKISRDGEIFVRAYSTNGNQISLKKITSILESNGFSVRIGFERYGQNEYGIITLSN